MKAKASYWLRVAAFLIDVTFCMAITLLIKMIFRQGEIAEYWTYWIVYYTYCIYMEYKHCQTLGKMIVRIHIVRVNDKPMDFWTSFYRNIGKVISALPLFYGFTRIMNPHQSQTMHDQLAGCLVAKHF
jgi:uncharacterized RDD family membrane protein YckC